MYKKFLSLLLSICVIVTITTPAFAKEKANPNTEMLNDPLYYSQKTIINTQIFTPDKVKEQKNSKEITPNVIQPDHYGQVKIEDSITDDSGIQDSDSETGSWETIKYSVINILPYIPVVGQLAATVLNIKDGIVAVYTDIQNFDTSRTTSAYTRYVYRFFYHTGYVWNYDNTWKFEGESTSKHYYKVETFDCIVNGTFESRTLSCTAGNGYGPTATAKASNYMNYSALANIFYEVWAGGSFPYYETY